MRALRTIVAITLLLALAPDDARAQADTAEPPAETAQPPAEPVEAPAAEPGDSAEPVETAEPPATEATEPPAAEATEPPAETAEVAVEDESAAPPGGRLRVVANLEGARVIVDGSPLGTVPFEGDLSAGPHRLRVESDGMKAYEVEVTISAGRLTPVRARLQPEMGRGGAWVTTVFAAILVGAGIVLAVLGDDLAATLRAERDAGRLATDDPRLDAGMIYWIAADSGFGLGFIFGCLALYYFFYDPHPPSDGRVLEERDWAFAPLADPTRGLAGLSFGGSF